MQQNQLKCRIDSYVTRVNKFFLLFILLTISILLIIAGDVELNPGQHTDTIRSRNKELSICHLNMRSIRQTGNNEIYLKFELLKHEIAPYFSIITTVKLGSMTILMII